ncbi:hypothetical protein LSAT2_019139 [Lamellibrachia satsuma]|nr:hypothetical protein LSAT2_019139 [Lamellibrachia satsuma]
MQLGQNLPCSQQIAMHYSFDFAQQVHYPSNPLQPGPIYFLTSRKWGIFGVCCEAIPQQVNYLIDKGMATSKGSDAVISYLHHFFLRYELGEEVVHLHCDNCAGQNKNRYMLFYLTWRTIHGLHQSIELNFMVAGHTKFGPDWCFGLLKQKFRRTPVSCLDDMVRVTEESTVTGINIAQLVGTENQDVKVPLYNWQTFLADSFRPLLGMKQFQHFRFLSEEPGVVFARKQRTAVRSAAEARSSPTSCSTNNTTPPGLNVHRQWYLDDNIREFCHPNCVDVTCPEPT